MIFMPITGFLLGRRWDPRLLLGVGLATAAFSFFAYANLTLQAGAHDFLWPQLIQGAGMSAVFIPLTTIAMDQMVNQAAKLGYMSGGQAKIPVVFRTQEGAGRSSAAQHAQSLEAWFAHVPGLKVALPSTPRDAKGLLKTAIRDDAPVVFIEHKMLYMTRGEVPEGEALIPFGQAQVVREGSDVTVVALSRMVHRAVEAATQLAAEGISVEVIDPRTIVPLDIETILRSVARTGRLVVAHEAYERCGFGAELATQVMEHGFGSLKKPVRRVCGRNVPVPFAPVMEGYVIPGAAEIVKAVKELL
jgi:pyruvate dehydrogenase E1 component beta subunit